MSSKGTVIHKGRFRLVRDRWGGYVIDNRSGKSAYLQGDDARTLEGRLLVDEIGNLALNVSGVDQVLDGYSDILEEGDAMLSVFNPYIGAICIPVLTAAGVRRTLHIKCGKSPTAAAVAVFEDGKEITWEVFGLATPPLRRQQSDRVKVYRELTAEGLIEMIRTVRGHVRPVGGLPA